MDFNSLEAQQVVNAGRFCMSLRNLEQIVL